jgi:hypothetical protein
MTKQDHKVMDHVQVEVWGWIVGKTKHVWVMVNHVNASDDVNEWEMPVNKDQIVTEEVTLGLEMVEETDKTCRVLKEWDEETRFKGREEML